MMSRQMDTPDTHDATAVLGRACGEGPPGEQLERATDVQNSRRLPDCSDMIALTGMLDIQASRGGVHTLRTGPNNSVNDRERSTGLVAPAGALPACHSDIKKVAAQPRGQPAQRRLTEGACAVTIARTSLGMQVGAL